MKKFVVFFLFQGTFLFGWCSKEGACPEFDKFARVFAPHQPIENEFLTCAQDKECARTLYRQRGRWEGPIPLYHKGDNIERVVNAVRLKKCIEKHNLYLLDVADKYMWQARGTDWGNAWRIFVRVVEGDCAQFKISLELLEQLMVLAEETGFNDWGASSVNKVGDCSCCNWIWDVKRQKLVCIDTENLSFFPSFYCKRDAVYKLTYWDNLMAPDAVQRLYQRLAELDFFSEGHEKCISLPHNSLYDGELDLEKVKKEYWSSR